MLENTKLHEKALKSYLLIRITLTFKIKFKKKGRGEKERKKKQVLTTFFSIFFFFLYHTYNQQICYLETVAKEAMSSWLSLLSRQRLWGRGDGCVFLATVTSVQNCKRTSPEPARIRDCTGLSVRTFPSFFC